MLIVLGILAGAIALWSWGRLTTESWRSAMRRLSVLMLAASLAAAVPATAQQSSDPDKNARETAATPPPTINYLFPDLGSDALVYDGEYFRFRPIFAWVVDYTWLSQDDASVSQVGTQEDTGELRAGRLGFKLSSKASLNWEIYTTVDYVERRTREDAVFTLQDLQLRIPVGPVEVTVGKQKETFAYELNTLVLTLPQQERILLPFFPTRNIGISAAVPLDDGRMRWSAGVFNDWLETGESFSENSTVYASRLTRLMWESPKKTDYVHLGVGWKSLGADDGILRFSGRPESNVTDKYVDTGEFVGKRAQQLSLEGLVSLGRFSVLGEYIGAWVDAPDSGDPFFSGYYLAGSWFVTGESRPYVRAIGNAFLVVPRSRFGAVEVVVKYSHLDLRDGQIDGGALDKWHYGVNWWASNQWKLGLSYGDADLDRDSLQGNTKLWLARVQWLW
jgi:phosphate-selective porin OprO/OprP